VRLPKWLLARFLNYRLQAAEYGDLPRGTVRMLIKIADELEQGKDAPIAPIRAQRMKPGTVLVRKHENVVHHVMVLAEGYAWTQASQP